jgi:hypothetical protein
MLVMTPLTDEPIAVCDECGLPVLDRRLYWVPGEWDAASQRPCHVYYLHEECEAEFAAEAGSVQLLGRTEFVQG